MRVVKTQPLARPTDRRGSAAAPGRTGLGTGEIRSLTGLRGCAACMVMLYHFSLGVPADTLPLPLPGLLHNGYLCVDLFFVLSGFVMAYSQSGPFAGPYRVRVHADYLLARLARIYPLYALITLESFAMLAWRTREAGGRLPEGTLALNLGLIQAWGLAPSLEGATWSISTEWGAYLLFPLLLALTVSGSKRRAIGSAAAALLAIAAVAYWPGTVAFPGQGRTGPLDVYSSATPLPLLRCVAEFSLGLLTFRAATGLAVPIGPWAGALAAGTVALIGVTLSMSGLDVCVVALFPLLILALTPQRGRVSRFLAMRAPYRLGQWSYSLYLIHDKFSHIVTALRAWLAARIPLASVVAVGLVGAAVIAVSAISYYVIEVPLRRLCLRAVRRRRPVAIETAPAVLAQP